MNTVATTRKVTTAKTTTALTVTTAGTQKH
jgi:hypothetical protein